MGCDVRYLLNVMLSGWWDEEIILRVCVFVDRFRVAVCLCLGGEVVKGPRMACAVWDGRGGGGCLLLGSEEANALMR
jgi:hypothetical protein